MVPFLISKIFNMLKMIHHLLFIKKIFSKKSAHASVISIVKGEKSYGQSLCSGPNNSGDHDCCFSIH